MRNAKRIAARMAAKNIDLGRYVELEEKGDGNLEIVLTDEGREEIDEFRKLPEEEAMYTLLEDHMANSSWEWLAPEEVGALTSALILTHDAERDDDGKLKRVGRVYWDSDYQVQSTVEELAKSGRVTWAGADGAE
jgi:hypothetical protein